MVQTCSYATWGTSKTLRQAGDDALASEPRDRPQAIDLAAALGAFAEDEPRPAIAA